jgi:hypothetical protein
MGAVTDCDSIVLIEFSADQSPEDGQERLQVRPGDPPIPVQVPSAIFPAGSGAER